MPGESLSVIRSRIEVPLRIRSALKLYGAENLEIFVSERIKPGVRWNEEIVDNLQKADWLLLLYTDPSEERDWCLFEAGFFAGCVKGVEGRLVALPTMDVAPPIPFQRWQSVPVTDGTMVENFLEYSFPPRMIFENLLIQKREEYRKEVIIRLIL